MPTHAPQLETWHFHHFSATVGTLALAAKSTISSASCLQCILCATMMKCVFEEITAFEHFLLYSRPFSWHFAHKHIHFSSFSLCARAGFYSTAEEKTQFCPVTIASKAKRKCHLLNANDFAIFFGTGQTGFGAVAAPACRHHAGHPFRANRYMNSSEIMEAEMKRTLSEVFRTHWMQYEKRQMKKQHEFSN